MIFEKEIKEDFKKAAENNSVDLPIKKRCYICHKRTFKGFFSYYFGRVHFICEKCGV